MQRSKRHKEMARFFFRVRMMTAPQRNPARQLSSRLSIRQDCRRHFRKRDSLTFLAYDLDIRLIPRQESLGVRAQITVRNDGEQPLKRIALQLSSTLKWERIKSNGVDAKFAQHPVDSDADHTGEINEAVVTLPQPLAAKEELKLEVFYSGLIALSGERLERIGAPNISAERSDWDRVSSDFVGLRGFGNVIWYPVSAPPVLLGDGAKLFAEIGRQKRRQQQATVKMTVTSEYTADSPAPNLAVLNGEVVPVVQSAAPENAYPGVVTATLPATALGFATPSLFLLNRQKEDSGDLQIYAAPEDVASAPAYVAAVGTVTPLVQRWLGAKAKSALTVVGLPEAEDLASEEVSAYLTGFKAAPDTKNLESAMVHSLAHAYFRSPRVWLDEGVAQFLGSLWVEQVDGRHTAPRSPWLFAWRAGARRAGHSRRSQRRRPDSRLRHRLLPHQGDLCLLDVARPGGRCSVGRGADRLSPRGRHYARVLRAAAGEGDR